MSMLKEQIMDVKLVYTKNPLLLASIYVGSPLVLSNVAIERIKKFLQGNGCPKNVNTQITK